MNQKRILIIDDEFPMRYLIEHQLKQSGYDVCQAKDGQDGLRAAAMHKPDLILLDIMMPGMNGFDVCVELKNNPESAQIPVVFLTASETKAYKTRAFDVGGDDYLTKPFQPDELLAHISAVLRRTERIQTGLYTASEGKIVSMFSPKGGVGTTTLAIQLAEAASIHEGLSVVLVDLDLPLGGIAPHLHLPSKKHIVDLLNTPHNRLSLSLMEDYMQLQRANLRVIAAPGKLIPPETKPLTNSLHPILNMLSQAGYLVILDLGSSLNNLTRAALKQSDLVFAITSGQSVANHLLDEFLQTAEQMGGLTQKHILPVLNELYGESKQDIQLSRMPVARIPHASEKSRTRLWMKEQGIRKLVSVVR